MTSFTHIHSSSRFDRSLGLLEKAARDYNYDADLVTYTEVDFEPRERAIRRANGKEFGFVSGDESHANDSAISFRKDRFELLYSENFENSTQVVYRTDGHARDLPYSTIAVFEDKFNCAVFVIAVTHLSSGVESDLAKRNWSYRRANQWRQSFTNTKRRVNKLARTHNADARLIVADYNVNFKTPWVRTFIKSLAPGYHNTWKNLKVTGGTHGRRIIDATLLRGKLSVRKSAKLYKDDASSDHRPYIETLVWE